MASCAIAVHLSSVGVNFLRYIIGLGGVGLNLEEQLEVLFSDLSRVKIPNIAK